MPLSWAASRAWAIWCGDGQRLLQRERAAADALVEVLAVHQLQGQGEGAVRFLEAVDRRDVRVVQGGQELGLAAEAREVLRVLQEHLREELEGDLAAQAGVPRAVDLAHAAGPQEGHQVSYAPRRVPDASVM